MAGAGDILGITPDRLAGAQRVADERHRGVVRSSSRSRSNRENDQRNGRTERDIRACRSMGVLLLGGHSSAKCERLILKSRGTSSEWCRSRKGFLWFFVPVSGINAAWFGMSLAMGFR